MNETADTITPEINPSDEILSITEAAALKVYELVQEEGDASLRLRISIVGGGCSGFQYQFSFDNEKTEEDVVVAKTIDHHGSILTGEIILNMMVLPMLSGATIDYKNDINGERFVITNPHAKTTCGCGSSFDV